MGTHSEKPVLWGLQQNPRPLLVNGTNEHPRMTPSSTLTSQTSNTSSFNNNPQEQNEAATLLNVDGSTTTLTNIGNSSFATSVV
jgi:hypothetical protein